MKKSLIALAVLASATAANADTTLYGQISVGYKLGDRFEQFTDGVREEKNADEWVSKVYGSAKYGIKGHEDLGNGLNAVYKFEFGLSGDTKGEAVKVKKAYAGFSGDSWGTLTLGTQTSAFGEVSGWMDFMVNADGHYYLDENEGLANNSVKYVSPDFSGLTVYASAQFDGNGQSYENQVMASSHVTNRNHLDKWSIATSYANNGFEAALGFAQSVDVSRMVTTSIGYSNDQFGVGLNADYREVYEYTMDSNNQVEILDGENNEWSVSLNGQYNVTKNDTIYAAIGTKGTDEDEKDELDENQYFASLAYKHNFSKRTSLRAGYTFEDSQVDGDSEASTSHRLNVSVKHKF